MLLSSSVLCYLYTILLSVTIFITHSPAVVHGIADGTVRLYRNGVADTNQSWSSGIVQIYLLGEWGNICDDDYFGKQEADVVCKQLGYKEVDTFSNTGLSKEYGVDNSSTIMNDVFCVYSSYLAITQCEFDIVIKPDKYCGNDNDVIITCSIDRIWGSSPYSDYIRLTGGTYSNQGLLEVYCNGEWGTVCNDTFEEEQAIVACSTLGYNGYKQYNHLHSSQLQIESSDSTKKIWLNSLGGCEYFDTCFHSCQGCPKDSFNGVESCDHSQDVTLECKYESYHDKNKVIYKTCSDLADFVGKLLLVIVLTLLICCCAVIGACIVPMCVCWWLGVGVGTVKGKKKVKRPQSTVVGYSNNGQQPVDPDHVYATAPPQEPTSSKDKLSFV